MIVNLTNFVSASPRWRYRKIESAKKKPRYDSSKINNKKPRNLCREQFEITYMHSENGIKFDGKHRFLRSTVRRLNRNFRLFGFSKGAWNGNKQSGFIFLASTVFGFRQWCQWECFAGFKIVRILGTLSSIARECNQGAFEWCPGGGVRNDCTICYNTNFPPQNFELILRSINSLEVHSTEPVNRPHKSCTFSFHHRSISNVPFYFASISTTDAASVSQIKGKTRVENVNGLCNTSAGRRVTCVWCLRVCFDKILRIWMLQTFPPFCAVGIAWTRFVFMKIKCAKRRRVCFDDWRPVKRSINSSEAYLVELWLWKSSCSFVNIDTSMPASLRRVEHF